MAQQSVTTPIRMRFFLTCLVAFVFVSCNKEAINPAPDPFELSIEADRVIHFPKNAMTVVATSSNRNLADRKSYKYLWECIQVPAGNGNPTFGSPTSRITGVYSLGPGKYIFRVTATDRGRGRAEDTLGVEVLPDSLSGRTKIYDAHWTISDGAWFETVEATISVSEFSDRPDNTLSDVGVDDDSSGQWKVLAWNFKKNILTVYAPLPADNADAVVWENYYKLVGRKLKVRVQF